MGSCQDWLILMDLIEKCNNFLSHGDIFTLVSIAFCKEIMICISMLWRIAISLVLWEGVVWFC